MFSSKSFTVSGPIFRSLIHFKFIFVYGARRCSSFILLHIVDQFSQHNLLKRPSVHHCIFLPPLSKIRGPYKFGFWYCKNYFYLYSPVYNCSFILHVSTLLNKFQNIFHILLFINEYFLRANHAVMFQPLIYIFQPCMSEQLDKTPDFRFLHTHTHTHTHTHLYVTKIHASHSFFIFLLDIFS